MQETSVSSTLNALGAPPAAVVTFKTSQGFEAEGILLRLTPLAVCFEIYSPQVILPLSEVLTRFRIASEARVIYEGRAVVSSFINTGTALTCEVTLADSLLDFQELAVPMPGKVLAAGFQAFVQRWQKFYQVRPEFKLAVADLQSFLSDLRLWLSQIELGLAGVPASQRASAEGLILDELPARPALEALFEKFDAAASRVPEELAPAHRKFCRQQLHPLLLLAPFNHRIYTKPLGYAGDYEMIDMIIRNQYEGESLFAKLIHAYILDLVAARSVRNRASYFARRFVDEIARVSRQGRTASIYSLGCGPAREVQEFLRDSALADRANFRLLDFNEDTLACTGRKIDELRSRYGRRTRVELVKKSVYNLLKGTELDARTPAYDLIYCSGLYDYLNDRICRALNTYLYEQLLPGGILIVTNFDPSNPIRNVMEYLFEWFLIHRDAPQMLALAPEQATPEDCEVNADPTGCNVFLQVRKPLLAS